MSHLWSSILCIQISFMFVSTAAARPAADSAPEQVQKQPATKAAPQERPAPPEGRRRQPKPSAPAPAEDISKIPAPPGPMRLLFHSLTETRIRSAEGVEGVPPSTLRLTATMTGERLAELVGVGGLVIEELVDDTGVVLVKPEDVTESDRTATQAVKISARLMRKGSFQRTKEIKALSNRGARKLSKASGWVNVVYGGETEEVLVDNPLQYAGRLIENEQLKKLGLEIEVVKVGSDAKADAKLGKGVGLRFKSSRKQVRRIEFFDAWMRPVHPREQPVTPEGGERYDYFPFTVGQADADTQMVLTVYKHVETDRVEFEFNDLELP